jgi:hypothetical protein
MGVSGVRDQPEELPAALSFYGSLLQRAEMFHWDARSHV